MIVKRECPPQCMEHGSSSASQCLFGLVVGGGFMGGGSLVWNVTKQDFPSWGQSDAVLVDSGVEEP